MGVLDVIVPGREVAGPALLGRTAGGSDDAWRQARRRARGKFKKSLSASDPRRSRKARRSR